MSRDGSPGVLFAFRTHLPVSADLPPLYVCGLDSGAQYGVEGIDIIRSVLAWMRVGLEVELSDFSSTVRRIRRLNR